MLINTTQQNASSFTYSYVNKGVSLDGNAEKEFKKATETDFDSTDDKDTSAVVYDKHQQSLDSGLYKINRMSAEDRDKLVQQLKADQEQRVTKLKDLAKQMISKQTEAYLDADAVEFWQQLADGKFDVDEETKKKAQVDIAEDGYWGVKQTSQRLFDFASALAGDDVTLMKKMQDGVFEGYAQAEKTWGRELPQLCKDTLDATNQLFEDYFKAKELVITE